MIGRTVGELISRRSACERDRMAPRKTNAVERVIGGSVAAAEGVVDTVYRRESRSLEASTVTPSHHLSSLTAEREMAAQHY